VEGFEICLLALEVDFGALEGFLSVEGLAMLPRSEPRMSPEGSVFFSAGFGLEEPKSCENMVLDQRMNCKENNFILGKAKI